MSLTRHFFCDSPRARTVVAWSFGALAAGMFFLLLADLGCDPPGEMDGSAGMVFDPPSKCQAARNRILYGVWRTDDWTPYLHGALHTLVQTAVFYAGGINLVTMRLPGAVMFGVALILLAALAGGGRLRSGAALWALALGVINPFTLAYGRSGLLEPQLVFWMVVSAWALDRAGASASPAARRGRLLLAGLAAAAAFWTKGTAVYYIVPAVLVALIRPPVPRRDIGWFLFPLALAIGLYAGPFMAANREFFQREAGYWLARAHPADRWKNWSRQPVFNQLGAARWLLAAGLLAIPAAWRKTARPPTGLRLLGLTLLCGLQAVAFMSYRPLRYALPAFVMAIPLAAWWAADQFRRAAEPAAPGDDPPSRVRNGVLALLNVALLAYVLNFAVIYPWAARYRGRFAFPLHARLLVSAVAAAAAMLVLRGAGRRLRPWFYARAPSSRRGMVILVWLLIFAPSLRSHARAIRHYARHREHRMRDFSRRLGAECRDLMVAGTSPAFAVMENRHRARKVTDYGINHGVLSDPALTHLLIPDAWGQPAYFRRAFPETWARARPVERITISGFTHILYALDRLSPEHKDPSGASLPENDL